MAYYILYGCRNQKDNGGYIAILLHNYYYRWMLDDVYRDT